MALNSTKLNSLRHNCNHSRTFTPSGLTGLTLADSIASNVTVVANNQSVGNQLVGENESQRIIKESHENSWQTALLYISIILSVYLITVVFIGLRYAFSRYYDKTFYFSCCPLHSGTSCQFCDTSHLSCSCFDSSNPTRKDYFTSSPSSSRMAVSQLRSCNSAAYNSTAYNSTAYNSAAYISPDDLNTIEVTQTDEGLLETDL